jgi:Fe-S-cluster containining protein
VAGDVLMTAQERDIILALRPGHGRAFRTRSDGWVLMPQPCEFLTVGNTCGVYEVRPYNCRRYGCFRPDVKAEPWSEACLGERLPLRVVRREYARMQRHAQRWASQHGWVQQRGESNG